MQIDYDRCGDYEKAVISGTPKEIAALMFETQKRRIAGAQINYQKAISDCLKNLQYFSDRYMRLRQQQM